MRSPLTPILLAGAICAAIFGLPEATGAGLLGAIGVEAMAAPKG